MVIKAGHSYFVSDLISDDIIAILKILFDRHGKSSVIFSDNATNFFGASAELKRLRKFVTSGEDSNFLVSEDINRKFSCL